MKQTSAQWLFPKAFFVLVGAFILVFAYQTYLLVNALLPQYATFMKWLAVFSFDGMALIYFLAKKYYQFNNEKSLHAVKNSFLASFVGSFCCTIAYMILSNAQYDWSVTPTWFIQFVYVLVSLIFGYHCLIVYYIWDMEHTPFHVANENKSQYAHSVTRMIDTEQNTEEVEINGKRYAPVALAKNTGPIENKSQKGRRGADFVQGAYDRTENKSQ